MARQEIDPLDGAVEAIARMNGPGLLVTVGSQGNPITIGWANIGLMWKKLTFSILVRPNRFSFEVLQELDDFTVNVPTEGDKALAKAAAWCGSHSGRDGDKYEATGLTKQPGIRIGVPYITECPLHFECRTVHTNHVLDAELDPEIRKWAYPEGNLHKIWWGEILGAWRES